MLCGSRCAISLTGYFRGYRQPARKVFQRWETGVIPFVGCVKRQRRRTNRSYEALRSIFLGERVSRPQLASAKRGQDARAPRKGEVWLLNLLVD